MGPLRKKHCARNTLILKGGEIYAIFGRLRKVIESV